MQCELGGKHHKAHIHALYGDFEIVLNSSAALKLQYNFEKNGNYYVVSPGTATLGITGQGDVTFASRWQLRTDIDCYGILFMLSLIMVKKKSLMSSHTSRVIGMVN